MTIAIITEAGVRKVAPMTIAAQQAAASAALSAQVALSVQNGRVYPDYATGNTATTAGQYFIVAGSGSLGLYVHGTATALVNIAILDPSTGAVLLPNGAAGTPSISFVSDTNTGLYRIGADTLGVAVGGSEAIRVSSTGVGFGVAPAVRLHTQSSGELLRAETTTARGSGNGFITIRDPSGTKGYFGYGGANDKLEIVNGMNADMTFYTNNIARWQILADGSLTPVTDNALPFGGASNRCTVLWAATGTISTSDAREKTWRSAASEAELSAARRIIAELGFFQWNDAIAEKGSGGARYHFGARAQEVWAIMADEGLIDPIEEGVTPDSAYAFLCYDEWDDNEGSPAGNRFCIRPDQLAYFLIAAQEARLAALEERIATLATP